MEFKELLESGNKLLQSDQYNEAIEQYKKTIQINSDDAEAYGNWGIALGKLNRPKQAIRQQNNPFFLAFNEIFNTFNCNQEFFKFTEITQCT